MSDTDDVERDSEDDIVDEDHLEEGEEESERPETQAELLQRDDDWEGEEPLAEGEVPVPRADMEPSYAKCNAIPFHMLCERMESLLSSARNNHSLKELDRLERLLPATLIDYVRTSHLGRPPESIFPLFRLLMPENDSSRFISMKESLLADMYVEAFNLQEDRDRLKNYGNPMFVNTSACGDFSAVLEQCLQRKDHLKIPSNYSVKDINACLDELKELKVSRRTGHDWKVSNPSKKAKRPTLKYLRTKWLERFLSPGDRTALSALEHKWMVRIILRKLQLGVGPTKLFNWYDPQAMDLWNARSTLKRLCRDLAFASDEKEMAQKEKDGCLPYLVAPKDGLEFGTEFDPMRSEKTGFAILLANFSGRHRNHYESQTDAPLAAIHPAFTVETKLDGERMLVHFRSDGVVRMHSRSHVWYSKLYAPVLGPSLRDALERHRCDIILDGEVLAWDDARAETVPFGNNRTIATIRRNWMEMKGMIDKRDLACNIGEEGGKTVKVAESRFTRDEEKELSLAGEQCWLQFIAFDLLYMNGPGAEEILRSAVSPSVSPFPSPGSLIGLDCMERKKLLYRLVEVQPKKVEIVDTHVIRPNGGVVPGVKYFKRESEEYGYPMFTVDSIACCIRGEVSDLSTIDAKRRGMRSDDEISQTRARAVNAIYIHYVEKRREEGLIFKDLSTFYVPGEHHRSKRYWLKFKPDYFNGSSASDIDLVIVGAYFASGLRSAGQPSSFLCACVDASGGEQKFLPITKVNARSLKDDDYQRILNHTGYSFTLERVSFGKWDPDRDSVAPTVSYEVTNGKKDIPDLWICPENSVVVTLNAGEIVSSDSFPAGLTLRFPRITRLRMDGDAKAPHDIESNDQLWQRFEEVTAQRRAVESLNAMSFKSNSDSPYGCRFLTESQELRQKKQARTVDRLHYQPLVPSVAAEARLLVGRRFAVLNGRYSLHKDEIEVALSKSEGWYDDAARVESQGDVQAFIKRHGGVVRLAPINDCCVLGGMWNDGRVLAHGKEGFGILRWTYVYREVTRLKAAVAEGHNKETLFQIREPTLLDFLVLKRETDAHVLSRNADSKGDCAPRRIARECKIMDRLDLMMALRCVGQDRLSRSIIEKSREHGVYGAPSSSWDAETLRDTVWPMRRCLWPDGQNNCPVVLFPDIFRDDFELSEDLGPKNRLNEADSSRHTNHIHRSIPLAQSMGARVTYHLHSRTTHVLCDISGSREWTVWNQETNYASLGIRKSLSECLLRVCRERQIILLSPKYLSKVFSSGSS